MWLPTLLFTLFAAFSAVGAFLIVSQRWNRKVGIAGAFVTVLFYVALYAWIRLLIGPLDAMP